MTDVIEHPVVGFRSWKPSPMGDGSVRSRFWGSYDWKPGVNQAVCYSKIHIGELGQVVERPPHSYVMEDVPSGHCNCGLQAHHDFHDSEYYFRGGVDECVFGIVKGWGHMHIHPDGWRAQYAEIVAIVQSPNMPAARAAAAYYGVPLLTGTDESIEAMITEFGRKVPDQVRPDEQTLAEALGLWVIGNPKETMLIVATATIYVVTARFLTQQIMKHV
jgi:hypothetical protein